MQESKTESTMSVFKAYDIRGLYGSEIDADLDAVSAEIMELLREVHS